jgi:hypothetical protein
MMAYANKQKFSNIISDTYDINKIYRTLIQRRQDNIGQDERIRKQKLGW